MADSGELQEFRRQWLADLGGHHGDTEEQKARKMKQREEAISLYQQGMDLEHSGKLGEGATKVHA